MKDLLTVLIPTSPIPSHPSTAILDEAIINVRRYTDARIVVMFDGVHQSLSGKAEVYDLYLHEVLLKIDRGEYGLAEGVVFVGHQHQAIMTRLILERVKTPLIMFCEHDTSPIGDIPFDKLCTLIEREASVNCVRFNIFDKIPEEHKYLMLGEVQFWVGNRYDLLEAADGDVHSEDIVKLTRTIQWSQRPHIAKTDWYRKILSDHFKPDQKTMIEDVMHSVVQVAYEQAGKIDHYGLAIYTPDGNQLRSYHADGRGSDEKIIEG